MSNHCSKSRSLHIYHKQTRSHGCRKEEAEQAKVNRLLNKCAQNLCILKQIQLRRATESLILNYTHNYVLLGFPIFKPFTQKYTFSD